ncbi:hypothetical protein PV762_08255 [Mitsuaria sp. CC2]|uniref:hypothetical protein n=1 Tax=Mitsuaria sp. CC2 TaxID=3029186 RepID=UPI003B8D03D2
MTMNAMTATTAMTGTMTAPRPAPARAITRMAQAVLAALMLLVAMLTGTSAWATRDDGQWRILNARYGTSQRNMDVTGTLKELARRDDRVRVTNELFGKDPAYGQTKTLRIFARNRNGDNRTFEFREGSVIDGNDFTGWRGGDWGHGGWNGGWDGRPGSPTNPGGYNPGGQGPAQDQRLNIVRATYGHGGRFVDVTDRLRNISRGGRLDIRVDNDLADRDPAHGQPKTLRVYYTLGRGKEQMREAREGDRIRLP